MESLLPESDNKLETFVLVPTMNWTFCLKLTTGRELFVLTGLQTENFVWTLLRSKYFLSAPKYSLRTSYLVLWPKKFILESVNFVCTQLQTKNFLSEPDYRWRTLFELGYSPSPFCLNLDYSLGIFCLVLIMTRELYFGICEISVCTQLQSKYFLSEPIMSWELCLSPNMGQKLWVENFLWTWLQVENFLSEPNYRQRAFSELDYRQITSCLV